MAEQKQRLKELIETLERARDELALKIHLGGKEARDEWNRQEQRLEELRRQVRPYSEALGKTAENVGAAAELAVGELSDGYRKIRELLKS